MSNPIDWKGAPWTNGGHTVHTRKQKRKEFSISKPKILVMQRQKRGHVHSTTHTRNILSNLAFTLKQVLLISAFSVHSIQLSAYANAAMHLLLLLTSLSERDTNYKFCFCKFSNANGQILWSSLWPLIVLSTICLIGFWLLATKKALYFS